MLVLSRISESRGATFSMKLLCVRRSGGTYAGGAVMPLVAVTVAVIVVLTFFLIYLFSSVGGREEISGLTNLMALGALEDYFSYDCEDEDGCQEERLQAAVDRAEKLAAANPGLGEITITADSDEPGQSNQLLIEDLLYHYSEPADEDLQGGCITYPCAQPIPTGYSGNAIRLTGSITSERRGALPLGSGENRPMPVNVLVTAVPIHMCMLIDLSSSIQEDNHLRYGYAPDTPDNPFEYTATPGGVQPGTPTQGYRPGGGHDELPTFGADGPDEDLPFGQGPGVQTAPPTFGVVRRNESQNNYASNAVIYTGGQSTDYAAAGAKLSLDPMPPFSPRVPEEVLPIEQGEELSEVAYGEGTQPASFFAFHLQDGTIVPEISATVWGELETSRGGAGYTPYVHYQEDYQEVSVYSLGTAGYGAFAAVAGGDEVYHPMPGEHEGLIFETNPEDDVNLSYKINDYRDLDSSYYRGPEPFLSIMRGVHEGFKVIENRKVAGDKVCVIMFDSIMSWGRVLNLTDKFDYVDEYLSEFTDYDQLDTLPNGLDDSGSPDRSDPTQNPKWVSLNLFPTAATHTDIHSAMIEAIWQLTETEKSYPTNDSMVLFSDGLQTCIKGDEFEEGEVCASNYIYYNTGVEQILDFAYTSLYQSKTVLHMFIAGQQVVPHTLRWLDAEHRDETGEFRCLTDEKAREKGIPFTWGSECIDELDCMTKWTERFSTPFYQANEDWYEIVRMTGGLWGPLRPMHPDCVGDGSDTPIPDDCTFVSYPDTWRRVHDWECRTMMKQVSDYLTQVISDSSGYTIIESEGT